MIEALTKREADTMDWDIAGINLIMLLFEGYGPRDYGLEKHLMLEVMHNRPS